MCEVWFILWDKNKKKICGVYISSVIKDFSCGTHGFGGVKQSKVTYSDILW
jgi:hypothetical protein